MARCHILHPAPLHTQNNSLRYLVIQPTIPTDISNLWEVFKQLRTCIWPLPAHALSHILLPYQLMIPSPAHGLTTPIRSWVNQPTTPHDPELMSLHTYLTGHGTMSQRSRSVLLLPPVHPLINQIRHLDPSSMDQVVHPYPWSDHTRPSLNNNTQAQYLWSTPSSTSYTLIHGFLLVPNILDLAIHMVPLIPGPPCASSMSRINGSHMTKPNTTQSDKHQYALRYKNDLFQVCSKNPIKIHDNSW